MSSFVLKASLGRLASGRSAHFEEDWEWTKVKGPALRWLPAESRWNSCGADCTCWQNRESLSVFDWPRTLQTGPVGSQRIEWEAEWESRSGYGRAEKIACRRRDRIVRQLIRWLDSSKPLRWLEFQRLWILWRVLPVLIRFSLSKWMSMGQE